MNDLRFAIRQLHRSPGFALAAAVVALAIGIGANTALFSVVSAMLLSPLPFRDPERLVLVFSTHLESHIPESTTSGPDFLEWRRQAESFEELTAVQFNRKFNLRNDGEPAVLKGALVTPGLSRATNHLGCHRPSISGPERLERKGNGLARAPG